MLPFDSRDPVYKTPFGAVPAGEKIRFSLILHKDRVLGEPVLSVRHDGGEALILPMPLERGMDEGFGVYTGFFTPEHTGLYFYDFSFNTENGAENIRRGAYGKATGEISGGSWQQTVYNKDFKTPGWLSGGLIYQIFPDRFCRLDPALEKMPADRYYSGDWDAQPAYEQTGGKKVLGNDYYGGNIAGIISKLPYLNSLGVSCIYLNPIFEAHANHRYNTADYFSVDPLFGTEKELSLLCRQAHSFGMRVILDGVFSHTGSDSRYFNREGRYSEPGAYQSRESKYFHWFDFQHWPDKYRSWWGIDTLPEVNELSESYTEFITGENGVLRHWLRLGIDGWRLDVADELPDTFIEKIRRAVKAENPDALLLGEVWEDASNKYSYGCRRKFLMGGELDSVMNYPFAQAIIDFLTGGYSRDLMACVLDICENYPQNVVNILMNHIGTHDTSRILTVLAGEKAAGRGRDWMAHKSLGDDEYAKGVKFLKLASILQYTLPGVPSLYYGDEAGMHGYIDPFNRGTYPWGSENKELLSWYRMLGRLRAACPAFDGGEFLPVYSDAGHIAYIRRRDEDEILIGVNRWCDPEPVALPESFIGARVLFGPAPKEGILTVPAEGVSVLSVGGWADGFEPDEPREGTISRSIE